MSYARNTPNPTFVVMLVDEYGGLATGITAPAVYLSKSQGAATTVVQWLEGTDFTWHELGDDEVCKGWYKLRQVNSPSTDAVDTVGTCLLSVFKTDHDTASGAVVYAVEDRSASGPLPGAVADAVWDEAVADHAGSGTTGEELHVAKALLGNKREHTIATGAEVVKDNDGNTTLRTMTPEADGEDITVIPS